MDNRWDFLSTPNYRGFILMSIKQKSLYFVVVILSHSILFMTAASAQSPNFSYPYFQTTTEGYIVEQNEYACPAFGDWDDDGDPDLMVGLLYLGYVYYYENVSTGVEPEFSPHQLIYADGAPLSVGFT